ncbi:MAG: ATP-grasp domain-containing protein [Bacteroidales bacterium]|nr:ATP-grasp domain-containing protein [Bacteroidales bacterium]MCF8386570.1 ATP-grasp domain-containing protein [Bacteroidales bacterium]MCF8397783.1 ATP-grasp domain-containing protein [Bacteroidales bacterium]
MKKKYNIAVSGLNAIDSPGPGVAVIRALREAASFDVRIIGLAYESLEPGIYMHDLVDKTYHVPYPTTGIENLFKRLEHISSIEKIDMIIPNFDAELYSFIKLEKRLKEIGMHTFLPTMKQFEERHKHNLPEFGKKYDLHVPRSEPIYTVNDLYRLPEGIEYPLVVKGKYYDASIVYNSEQAKSAFNKISAKWGLPIIIQEFVHGTEYNVTGLGDGKGNTISAVPMRKQYITDKGKAWGGISIADKKMLELTDKFISQTKWRGGFELELMKDKKNDFYILEINPRIPAWVYLAVGVGQNIPEALVNLAMGEKVEPYKTYDIGKMFIRYAYDMIVDIKEFEQISTYGEL